MKTIFILCDTLNRRMLSAYGAGEDAAITPNIDRWRGNLSCLTATGAALRRACPHAATS